MEALYAAFAGASAELAGLQSPLQAELWTFAQLGVWERVAPEAEAHRRALGDLVGYFRRSRSPGEHAFLRAFASIGPLELRADAAQAAGERSTGPEPIWVSALGRVLPGEIWLIQDGSLGGDQVIGEFRYADGAGPLHALLVQIAQGRATRLPAIGDVPGMTAQIRQAVAAQEYAVLRLNPTVAGYRLRSAIGVEGDEHSEDYHAVIAFARHRIAGRRRRCCPSVTGVGG
jgi:hypothetical protein